MTCFLQTYFFIKVLLLCYIKLDLIHEVTDSNTTNKIPPPGPNRSTLGMKPLYKAEKLETLYYNYTQTLLPFFTCNCGQGWEGPIVFGYCTGTLILNSGFDYIKGCIQNGTKSTTNRSGNEIVKQRFLGISCFGKGSFDTMNDTKITTIPGGVTEDGRFQAFEESKGTFFARNLQYTIKSVLVSSRIGLILHANLDQFKGDDYKGFSYTRRNTSGHRQALCHAFLARQRHVQLGVLFIGSKFGGTLRGFNQDWCYNSPIKSAESFILDNLFETICYGRVFCFALL